MRKITAFFQYLFRSLFYAHRKTIVSDFISVVAIVTLTLTAYMVAFFIYNFKETLLITLKGVHVLVYLQKRPSEAELTRIKSLKWVKDVRLISGELLLKEEFGERGVEAFKKADVTLPWVAEISLKETDVTAVEVKKDVEALLSPIYVDTGENLSRSLKIFVTLTGLLTFSIGVLFLLGISVVVAGGVRNNILMEKESIEVLNLVGATRRYIFFPYILKQAYMTFFSLLASALIFKYIVKMSFEGWREIEFVFHVKGLPTEFYSFTLITGIAVSIISSYFSLRRLV